ncbi:hypothetical protein MMC12_004776 [Toensbergia leucococca]|nr:hypothetical protein [Toensbergia leucococca]
MEFQSSKLGNHLVHTATHQHDCRNSDNEEDEPRTHSRRRQTRSTPQHPILLLHRQGPIINTTSRIQLPNAAFIQPAVKGFDRFDVSAYSFLIEHPSGRKLLFDLGSLPLGSHRRPLNLPIDNNPNRRPRFHPSFHPLLSRKLKLPSPNNRPRLSPPARTLLHRPSTSNPRPVSPPSTISTTAPFTSSTPPGHAIGHLCALARTTTTTPDAFIFMGGDACHDGGQFRPTPYLPLPESIFPNPLTPSSKHPCPGALFMPMHRSHKPDESFLYVAEGIAHDVADATESIRRLEEFDGYEDVFTVFAHDGSLVGVGDLFLREASGWMERGWREEGKWGFLSDFGEEVEVGRRLRWGGSSMSSRRWILVYINIYAGAKAGSFNKGET